MPRPNDSPDVQVSKTLAYILRHGAEKEGLHIRSDGFIKLNDVLARPKLRGVDIATVLRLVEENAKKRFEVVWGYDPSPPPVKGKKGQGKGQGKGKGKEKDQQRQVEGKGKGNEQGQEQGQQQGRPGRPHSDGLIEHAGSTLVQGRGRGGKEVDASRVDDIRVQMERDLLAGTNKSDEAPADVKGGESDEKPKSTELPLVLLPRASNPGEGETSEENNRNGVAEDAQGSNVSTTTPSTTPNVTPASTSSTSPQAEWFIRASQGHSIQLESVSHLVPVQDDEDGRKKVGEMVHGTKWELWDVIRSSGLSRMSRQHIHLAPTLDPTQHYITPRPSSTLYIYLDLGKVLAAGIPVYTSANGVILTPGDEAGYVGKELWKRVERREVSKGDGEGRRVGSGRMVVWEGGEVVDPPRPVE